MGFYESAVNQMERDRVEQSLVCPHCGAANRKGMCLSIEIDDRGSAYCTTCGYTWCPQLVALGRGLMR